MSFHIVLHVVLHVPSRRRLRYQRPSRSTARHPRSPANRRSPRRPQSLRRLPQRPQLHLRRMENSTPCCLRTRSCRRNRRTRRAHQQQLFLAAKRIFSLSPLRETTQAPKSVIRNASPQKKEKLVSCRSACLAPPPHTAKRHRQSSTTCNAAALAFFCSERQGKEDGAETAVSVRFPMDKKNKKGTKGA